MTKRNDRSYLLNGIKTRKGLVWLCFSSGQANGIVFDRTTSHCIENLIALDYGSVDIVNLFATIGNGKAVIDNEMDGENRNVDVDMGGFVVVCEKNESLHIENFNKNLDTPEFAQVICP